MNNHIRKIAYQENSAADVLKNPHAKNGKKNTKRRNSFGSETKGNCHHDPLSSTFKIKGLSFSAHKAGSANHLAAAIECWNFCNRLSEIRTALATHWRRN